VASDVLSPIAAAFRAPAVPARSGGGRFGRGAPPPSESILGERVLGLPKD